MGHRRLRRAPATGRGQRRDRTASRRRSPRPRNRRSLAEADRQTVTFVLSVLGVGAVLASAWLLGFAISTAMLPRERALSSRAPRLVLRSWAARCSPAPCLRRWPFTSPRCSSSSPSRPCCFRSCGGSGYPRASTMALRRGSSRRSSPRPPLSASLVYTLRALTEPMWANDFIAIWGLKGKTIYGARGYPDWLHTPSSTRIPSIRWAFRFSTPPSRSRSGTGTTTPWRCCFPCSRPAPSSSYSAGCAAGAFRRRSRVSPPCSSRGSSLSIQAS